MHVDGKRGRGCGARETLLQDGCLGEAEPGTTAILRHEDREVSRRAQVGEILLGEGVLAVVRRRPRADALDQVVGQISGGVEVGHTSIVPLPIARRRRAGQDVVMSRLTRTLIPPVQRQPLDAMNAALDMAEGDALSKRTGFLIMLILSGVIAISGVLGDSVATVIGAMIIAPLGTPILGIALGIVTGHLSLVVRSVLWVFAGLVIVVSLGWLFSFFVSDPSSLTSNSQVVGRTSPGLLDLLAALATGTAGAFAMCRRDLSVILPGVAIAISLVPPLGVVGVCAGQGEWSGRSGRSSSSSRTSSRS